MQPGEHLLVAVELLPRPTAVTLGLAARARFGLGDDFRGELAYVHCHRAPPHAQFDGLDPQLPHALAHTAACELCAASATARSRPMLGRDSHGGAVGSPVCGGVSIRARAPTRTQPSAPGRSSAAPEILGRRGTPKPNETARGSLRGGASAGLATSVAGDEDGERFKAPRMGPEAALAGSMLVTARAATADAVAAGIDPAPSVRGRGAPAPAPAEGGCTSKAARACEAAASVRTTSTAWVAALTPPAAESARPACAAARTPGVAGSWRPAAALRSSAAPAWR